MGCFSNQTYAVISKIAVFHMHNITNKAYTSRQVNHRHFSTNFQAANIYFRLLEFCLI